MKTDFSFKNPAISKFFNEDYVEGNYAPIQELIYIHSHPLVQPNFVEEINWLNHVVLKAFEKNTLKYQGELINRLAEIGIALAKEVGHLPGTLEPEKAKTVLFLLKENYKTSMELRKLFHENR